MRSREGGNCEVFCHLRLPNSGWMIRAKARNRRLLTVEGESITRGGPLEHLTIRGHDALKLRARPNSG
jgi:hypothetical protein